MPGSIAILCKSDLESVSKVVRRRLTVCDSEGLKLGDISSVKNLLLLRVVSVNNCTRLSEVGGF